MFTEYTRTPVEKYTYLLLPLRHRPLDASFVCRVGVGVGGGGGVGVVASIQLEALALAPSFRWVGTLFYYQLSH